MIEITAVVAAIVGIVEAIKRTSFISNKFFPFIALGLGVLWFGLTGELSLAENIFAGIIAGLSASGLYDSGKAIIK